MTHPPPSKKKKKIKRTTAGLRVMKINLIATRVINMVWNKQRPQEKLQMGLN